MIVSIRAYEQYCIHFGKNITIEEIIHSDGTKTVICKNREKCKKCKNKILSDYEKVNY